jgi:hypothetical protein
VTFAEFYRTVYLPAHREPVCRWLHMAGLPVAAAYAGVIAYLGLWWWLVLLPVPAYLFGWLGHLVVHNRPTFFRYPWQSFLGFWTMIGAMLAGKLHGRATG